MTSERCGFSDLPVTMCGHCQGIGPIIGRITPGPPPPAYPPGHRPVWTPAMRDTTPRDWHDGDKAPGKSTRCTRRPDGSYVHPWHLPTCTDHDCNGCAPCDHDDDGNPIRHCEARRDCTEHLDHAHPHACPRCIARTRADIDHIVRLSGDLMLDQAIVTGVESEAAMIAGPAADPATIAEIPDDRHPYTLLVRWEQQLAENYRHRRPAEPTIATAASYLSWLLTDVAHDPAFGLLASDMSRCRTHLEAVLIASRSPERGAPCWKCPAPAPRLQRKRAHWCEREDCTREHDVTGARDTWVCPRNPDHWWTEAEYRYATYEAAVLHARTEHDKKAVS